MTIASLPTLPSALRRLLAVVACLAACACGDAEIAPPSLLLRAAHAQAAVPAAPADAAVPPSTLPAAAGVEPAGTGAAALHSYRDDVDPGHAAIASYRD